MATADHLSDAKRRLLERFLRGEAARQSWELPLPARVPGEPIPIAPVQQHLLLHSQMAPDSALYTESVTVYFRGELDRQAFERAFREIVRRHEIWRTGFASVDGETVQAVYADYEIPIPFADLTELPEHRREAEALRLAVTDVQRPMDPAMGPLLRPRLIKLGAQDYRCYLAIHHLIHDGVTIYGVFFPELAALYDAFSKGQSSPLAEPQLQFADYALWEKGLLDNDVAARQRDYWRRQLSGNLPQLQLPTDRPRPPVPTYRGAIESLVLPPELTEELKQLSRDEGVTLYMLLLAVFQVLLFRYTGQEDLIAGTLTDNRRRSEFQRVMGYFLNTLPLRTHPSGSMPFREYLREVKDAVLGSFAHSQIPFDHLVREVQPQRDPSRHPLFQVMFVLEPAPPPVADPRWDLKQGEAGNGAAKFDLYLELDQRAEGMAGRIFYSTDLFEAATVRRMIGNWITLLQGVLRDPGSALSGLPLLSGEETRLLEEWNQTGAPVPASTIHGMFEERAAQTPHAVAVECDGAWLTYHELNQAANRLARTLVEAGAGPDVRVGICVERGCEMVVAMLAVLKAGAAYLPLDPALPEERFRLIVDDAQAPILLTEETRAARLPATGARLIFTNQRDGSGSNLSTRTAPSDLAYVLYTSGSTGGPKGVEIPHSAVVNFLESMRRQPGFAMSDTLLAVTTLSFDIAALEILLPLTSGGRVVIANQADARDPARLTELVREVSPSVMQATPATWRALVEAGWGGDPDLKILCGGEAMSPDLARQLLPRCAELWNMYGPTETTIWSTLHRVKASPGSIPIGKPIANTQVYILDQCSQMVPLGVTGELCIGGAGLARGYVNRPELTRQRFAETKWGRLYRTGDLARWRHDGTLECLGRADNQVKIRGFRIELEEIEAALLEHPEISGAAVKAWPDSSGHLSLTAYMVSNSRPAIRAFLDHKLPDYMIPTRAVWLEALPLTPNGKIDRNRLPQPEADEVRAISTPPATALERRLAPVWESVLGQKKIGRHDNFFELGGHSLLVAKLLRRVEAEFGVRLSMAAVFQAPSLAQFAELVGSQDAGARSPKVSPIQSHGSRPPLFWMNAGPRYRALTARLGKDRPFLGVSLDPNEEAALPGDASLQEFAAGAIRKIRAIRPHGPYHLGGLCVSGLLAYEVAAQLAAAGEEVSQVVMLDAVNLNEFMERAGKKLLASRIRFHWNKLTAGPPREIWRYLTGRLRYRANRGESLALWSEKLYQAALGYRPPSYAGRVLMVEPSERLDIANLEESWANVSQPARKVQRLAGNHENILQEPMVADLAEVIRHAMETAEAAREAEPDRENPPLRTAVR